jgi:hypothetical protein
MTIQETAEKIWLVLVRHSPAENTGRLASLSYDLATALAKEQEARANAGVNVPGDLAEKALVTLVEVMNTASVSLATRACDLAQAMGAEQQARFPFFFAST